MRHTFTMDINWTGGRDDVGNLEAERLSTKISIPPEMQGPGIGTNPDEMLLGASGTCYVITLAAMLERMKVEAKLSLQSEGIVDVTNGVFTYEKIIHHVTIELTDNSEKNQQLAHRHAMKAEGTCMISKALKGNVAIQIDVNFA